MKKENAIIDEFTLNMNGVTIKKCCASCETHAPYDSNGPRRMCTFNNVNLVVQRDDCCRHWSISAEMNRIRTIGHGI